MQGSNSTTPLTGVNAIATSLQTQPSPRDLHPLPTLPTLSLKEQVLKQLHLLTYYSGASAAYAATQQTQAATILMYHSIPEDYEEPWMDPCNCMSAEQFETQMQFLAEHRQVVSLDRLLEMRQQGEPIAKGTVAITFDDGYRNNLTVAAPILAKYQLPATLYLATGFISAGKNQWIDTLYSAFRARSQHQLDLSSFASTLGRWDLSNAEEQMAAYGAIGGALIEATLPQRNAILEALDKQLAPSAYPPRMTMNWEEVRQLHEQYPNFTLGVHTANHLDLSTHSDQAEAEVKASIEAVVQTVGYQPKHFAFPYNRFNAESQAQVARYLSSAVAEDPTDPVIRSSTNNYSLPRLEAPSNLTMLKSWTNGGFPDFNQKVLRRIWTKPH